MRHLLLTIFLGYPVQHPATAVVVEIHINIRQRNTVGVQEAFEKQVVFNRVYLCDSQAISHRRTCSRTTSRTYRYIEFFASGLDKILHNEEVPRETHGLHNMEFELDSFARFLVENLAISSVRSFQSQFLEVVCFELDSVQFIVTTQFIDFGMGLIFTQDYIAVFVLRKLVEQIFFRILLSIPLFGSKIFGNFEVRHNGGMVDAIEFNLVANIRCIGQSFRHISKQFVHLGFGLEPLLLGIKHTVRVVQVSTGTQTNQAVVSFSILFVDEVHIVCTN